LTKLNNYSINNYQLKKKDFLVEIYKGGEKSG